jgi:uncharacterized protein YbaR (Trm112 family)
MGAISLCYSANVLRRLRAVAPPALDGVGRMPVDPELLEILACPNCKTKVELVKNGTALKCGECKRVYPIKDDIPVMLIDEATIEP